ncbi:YybH family protein [Rheinheimera sp.]|uniref:YybH family protein n=1 Tax=Rheinheimera sp. TaxID=1869214 RepID=UPI003AF4F2B0
MSATHPVYALQQAWALAAKRQDLPQTQSFYQSEFRAFDAVKQLQFNASDYFVHWGQCMEFCPQHSHFDLHQVQLHSSGDLAVVTALLYCAGTDEQGNTQGCWLRLTQAWQLQHTNWQIIHDHFSVPFDMVSTQVLFQLTPEQGESA